MTLKPYSDPMDARKGLQIIEIQGIHSNTKVTKFRQQHLILNITQMVLSS